MPSSVSGRSGLRVVAWCDVPFLVSLLVELWSAPEPLLTRPCHRRARGGHLGFGLIGPWVCRPAISTFWWQGQFVSRGIALRLPRGCTFGCCCITTRSFFTSISALVPLDLPVAGWGGCSSLWDQNGLWTGGRSGSSYLFLLIIDLVVGKFGLCF